MMGEGSRDPSASAIFMSSREVMPLILLRNVGGMGYYSTH